MKKATEGEASSVSSSTISSNKLNLSSSNRSLEDTSSTAEGSSVLSVSSNYKEKAEDTNVDDSPPLHRVLQLCKKNEWGQVDSVLRGLRKGAHEVNYCDENGMTPIMFACKENKMIVIERLADLGAALNDTDKEGRSALHYASQYAKEDAVRVLLARKADPNIAGGPLQQLPLHMACARGIGAFNMCQQLLKASNKNARLTPDKNGSIPLFLAAECGSLTTCRDLLSEETEAQIHYRKANGDTVLHIACRSKDYELVKILVEKGASINIQNNEGLAPLHISAIQGDEQMIRFLHGAGAESNLCDKQHRSALHVAAEQGYSSIVDLLVDKAKADPLARTKDGSTLLHVASASGYPDTAIALVKKGVPLMMPNKNGAICLHTAAQHGHVSVVRALLNKGAAVDAKTKDQHTALHIAVEACKPLVIQTLLGYGAQVELKGGKAKETPLHIAARIPGAEQCVEMLIKCGADVNNFKDNGETALHIAARHGHLKVVEYLLDEDSDPTLPSKAGETPVHVAARYCHWEVCDELLSFVTLKKSRFDAAILVNLQNNEGETSVHYAAELIKTQAHHEFEDTDIVRLLLEYGGDTNIQTKLTQETPVHYCARAGNADILLEIVKHIEPSRVQIAVNKQSRNGWSPLLVASKEGHIEIVKILLYNHARVDVFDEHGKAALHLAAECGHVEVADVLLTAKAFVNAKSKIGLTPLHLAAQNGYNGLVGLLIQKHGATVDALSLAKKTPLHMAAETGQMEVCSTLLSMSADANATDENGQTPLHLAAENDHSDVIKLFLKHKPDLVTMANTKGMTYAHIAASKGSVGVIKELMRFNKDVITKAKNKTDESTSLHLAAEGGHKGVVEVLLKAGANPLEENADGMTALHLAAKHGHIEILDVLKDHLEVNTFSSKSGFTPLHVAAHFGQTNAVRELLTRVSATVISNQSQNGAGKFGAESKFKRAANKALAKFGNDSHGLTPLHLAAQSGHEALVRVLLNSNGVQADAATTVQGSTPLHLAAQNGHTSVVSLLLSKSTTLIHTRDKRGRSGLHLAANSGQLEMVALLIGQGSDVNAIDKNGWTSLHYAAKAGHLNVVTILCDSAASTLIETKDGKTPICYAAAAAHTEVLSFLMRKKHDTHSLMDDKKFVFDLMVCGKINEQRTIEEFINLSPAPCETAVKMSKNFAEVAVKEKERAKDLICASQFCEVMATELMAIAASTNSPSILLKSVDNRGMPFLDVLIECAQKEVVAHPTIQKYLSDVWLGGIQWKGWKFIALFLAFCFCPPIWFVFSLPMKHRYSRVPIFKFMSGVVSHFFLIVLLILVVAIPVRPIYESYDLFPNSVEWLLLIWLSGLLVAQLTNPGGVEGLSSLKVVVLFLGAIAAVVHLSAFAFEGNDRFTCIYIRNQLLAVALLCCFILLLDFLTFHHVFGPWTIIIASLLFDFIKFLVILVSFMLGFTFHLSAVYQPVYPPVPYNETLGDGLGNSGAIHLGFLDVFELLLFSVFGLVDPENLPPVNSSPVWAREIIKGVFAVYLLITLIILINLLIAMMSDTYQRIQAMSDTEWKFGRSKLFRNINKTSPTPPPINLLSKLFIYCKVLFKHKGRVCSAEGQDLIDEEEGLDAAADEQNIDQFLASQGWLRGGRGSQIAPETAKDSKSKRPQRLEDSIDWKSVVHKYYVNKGQAERDNSEDDSNNPNLLDTFLE